MIHPEWTGKYKSVLPASHSKEVSSFYIPFKVYSHRVIIKGKLLSLFSHVSHVRNLMKLKSLVLGACLWLYIHICPKINKDFSFFFPVLQISMPTIFSKHSSAALVVSVSKVRHAVQYSIWASAPITVIICMFVCMHDYNCSIHWLTWCEFWLDLIRARLWLVVFFVP